jgi:hypothetical protein
MVAKLDCDKLTRLADGVDRLVARFDAMVAPSEYKKLVKDRDAAKAALVALQRKAEESGYAGLNFRNVEAEYTRASKALAAAQMKMTEE